MGAAAPVTDGVHLKPVMYEERGMKKNRNRLLSLLLCAVMFLSLLPVSALAEEGEQEPLRVEFRCEPADAAVAVFDGEEEIYS